MAADITTYLKSIRQARYGKDVREAIASGIETCYNDGKTGATDLQAREDIIELRDNFMTQDQFDTFWDDITKGDA